MTECGEKISEKQRRRLVTDALKYHSENFPRNGKIEVISKVVIRDFL